ncbi:hypothetical protein PAMC26510_21285 [Caballeronia sordidicola]|uniref:Uncharacterized protein n=1 Tax=Caballeronia sordidicola TaxID=196367 RepID=A0A242MMZ6_CABSO|nr:hypothetical protein PAMC26510_21285 [Caballeronia sordidicola]
MRVLALLNYAKRILAERRSPKTVYGKVRHCPLRGMPHKEERYFLFGNVRRRNMQSACLWWVDWRVSRGRGRTCRRLQKN